jgi:hypothetical protein
MIEPIGKQIGKQAIDDQLGSTADAGATERD